MRDGERGRYEAPDDADAVQADAGALRQHDEAYVAINELQQRLASVRRELQQERAERQRLAKRRKPGSVGLRQAARVAIESIRALRGRVHVRRRPHGSTVSGGGGGAAGAVNPFFARVESASSQAQANGGKPGAGVTSAFAASVGDPPLVSIVMVVSDAAVSVDDCVQSIMQQTYCRWELIVRDCRHKGWFQPAIGVGDDRVSCAWVRSGSEGVARNHGLAEARGELIAYLDPPNLWHPRFLETLVPVVIGDRSSYLAYCDRLDAASAEALAQPAPVEAGDADYAELVGQGAVALNAVVHRRELYDEIGGAKDGRIGHDRDLLLKYTFVRDPRRVESSLLLEQEAERSLPKRFDAGTSGPSLRASAETYFRDELPRPTNDRPPGLTVVNGIAEPAQERAWDLAAVAGETTFCQLVSFPFDNRATYGRRLLPAPETRMICLEGGGFPKWASMLARGVASVHGEVVYAAEPRLASLGLALLASYHHGTPVLADLSHAPAGELPSVEVGEVDPRDPALLDPCSPLWDRIMAGIARSLPSCLVGSFTSAEGATPRPLVLHHPKDDAVFDPNGHHRELVRQRLGIGLDECVLTCRVSGSVEQSMDERVHLFDNLASACRLLILSADRPSSSQGAGCLGGSPHVVDRTDDEGVAEALAASDALLLWDDPQDLEPPHAPPSELISALAMGVPAIANNTRALDAVGMKGWVRFVPYGDVDALAGCLNMLRGDEWWQTQVAKGRHLFMRQFSYTAAQVNLSMILRLVHREGGTVQHAEEFAEFFSNFYRHASAVAGKNR